MKPIARPFAVILLLAGGILLAGCPHRVERLDDGSGDFDQIYDLAMDGSPLGLASNGRELIVANRKGGLLRIRRDGKHFEKEVVAVTESVHGQNIGVNALTWNGRDYVGVALGNWFNREGEVFTIHDAKTLQLVDWKPAPPLLGCLAWDGRSYWAATRKHTADQDVPSLIYKLDPEFNVIEKSDAPGVGCQGMAWDGRYLWLADVFSDAITIVDPRQSPPKVVRSSMTSLSYLSGITVFEKAIWVTDYDANRLRRLRPKVRTAWAGSPAQPQLATMVPATVAEEPQTSAHHRNDMASRPADDAELLEWSAEIRDGSLYASWQLWFGHDVFVQHEQTGIVTVPQFARYTITVTTPSGQEIETVHHATPGEVTTAGVRLCEVNESGEYEVGLFIHVQFVAPDGEGKILNRSVFPLRVTAP